ncbi:MAG: hypothetical protein DMG72_11230 [Acidobacteria bacterium]|nr:MAG: hypothetical protein DMG72_11230 [Acidobacteriota bacterium]
MDQPECFLEISFRILRRIKVAGFFDSYFPFASQRKTLAQGDTANNSTAHDVLSYQPYQAEPC